MTVEESWVSAMRAQALAKLLLTERTDLDVVEEPSRLGYDYLVNIQASAVAMTPIFAVEVEGTRRRITSQILRDWLVGLRPPKHLDQMPWCLFIFQVETRQGMYCWLNEPLVLENAATLRSVWEPRTISKADLLVPTIPSLVPLDRHALDEIVSRVIDWAKVQEYTILRHVQAS
jgi:hypothetical protein